MTSVNITTTKNTVEVTENPTTTVTIATQGAQGESFAVSGTSLNDSNKVNNSVVYFDSTSATFKADNTRTVENLVDGGNF
tara:strand:- start:131 stop:370 length:240 start_codon:yes stop_codon:yes gene_type:complete